MSTVSANVHECPLPVSMSVRPPLFTRGGADTDTQTETTEMPMKTPPPRTLPARLRADLVELTATRNAHGQIELSIPDSPITFVLEHRVALELADAIVDATEQRNKRRRNRRRRSKSMTTQETP